MSDTVRNLAVRLTGPVVARLKNFEETSGADGTTLARNLLEPALDYWEENGSITFPVVVLPKVVFEQMVAAQGGKAAIPSEAKAKFFAFAKSIGIDFPKVDPKNKGNKV